MDSSRIRRLARVTAVSLVVGLPLLAAPSYADVPEGWSEPDPVNGLHALLVLAGIPLALIVVITLLTVGPSLARGERGPGHQGEDEWFGGPRTGTAELESTPSNDGTGGASGRW